MDKRYQVFISSTYKDLLEERQEVIQALLELDCIPAGMELFPAADDDQWTLIKKVIDDCDYYIIVVGGRYGSISATGISYTEMEYDYAVSQGKPVIGFIHKDPGSIPSSKTEQSSDGKAKLDTFRKKVEQKMCKFWSSPSDLGAVVSRSLVQLIKSKPAIGWVRANLVPDEAVSNEILNLKNQIEELEKQLEQSRLNAPKGTEELAQGSDTYSITYTYSLSHGYTKLTSQELQGNISLSWNEIFAVLSPLMMNEEDEYPLRHALGRYISSKLLAKSSGVQVSSLNLSEEDFQTIKVQLTALGLITKSHRQRSVKDRRDYWTLTPYGETVMNSLRAIKKSDLAKPKAKKK